MKEEDLETHHYERHPECVGRWYERMTQWGENGHCQLCALRFECYKQSKKENHDADA